MAVPIIPVAAFSILACLFVYRFIVVPAFLSPLSKFPSAHWSAPFSNLWILYHRSREQETPTVHALHQRLGDVVRLGPNDLSVNCVDNGIRNIYSGGYEKGDWYSNAFSNYGVTNMPMFAMPDHGSHSKRKRMLSNIYAKSTLQTSEPLAAISRILLKERLLPRLRDESKAGRPVDLYFTFCAITHDFVAAYCFGLKSGSDFVRLPDSGEKFFFDYKARQRYQFWGQDLPQFTALMAKIGWRIVPQWVNQANADIEAMILRMADGAEATLPEIEQGQSKPEDYPTVYSHLRTALYKDTAKANSELTQSDFVEEYRKTIASEMLDHTLAGFDTSSITLTFHAWELSRPHNAKWQEQLREELRTIDGPLDSKAVDSLPILNATLMESLRLHAAIPGNQPRITPANAVLGEISDIPAGVRVQSQAWSLHRNPRVFPSPDSWLPERWLESSETQLKEMNRWFWAFGSGGRMCVGSNLAMYDMKAIIASVWREFETSVVFDEGMVHNGGYVAEPVGKDGKFMLANLKQVDLP